MPDGPFLLLGVGSGHPSSGQSSLLASLISHWKMDEASGDATDSHGSNTLTDNATVTTAAGKLGTARQFTAANTEFLSRASNATLQAGDIDFTFAAWVYLDSVGTNRVILAKDGNTAGQREYNIDYLGATQRFRFYGFTATDSAKITVASALGAPSVSTWYFVVAWHDSAGDTVNIQVNNGTVDSTATTGALQAASNGEFRIGARSYPGFVEPFDGRIDSVSFWKRVLTSDERTALYNGGSGLEYPFA